VDASGLGEVAGVEVGVGGAEVGIARGAVARVRIGGAGGSGSDSSGSSHDAVKRSARRSASLSLSGATDERSGSGMAV